MPILENYSGLGRRGKAVFEGRDGDAYDVEIVDYH